MSIHPIEEIIAEGLTKSDIDFIQQREVKGRIIDFYLPTFQVYIECKFKSTERELKQTAGLRVIIIQGEVAARAFVEMINYNSIK